eukprot:3214134-Amphidinium_carterae.2
MQRQGLVESGVITVHKLGTQNNPSDILAKFMPQSTLSKHFSKVGLAEISTDEVSIQHLRVSAISSSSTAELDVRNPKSSKFKYYSVAVSSQETPERSEQERPRKCEFSDCQHMHVMSIPQRVDCKRSNQHQWCCHLCMPRAVKCHHCQRWHSMCSSMAWTTHQNQRKLICGHQVRSTDFINRINFPGRDADSFQLVDQDVSDSDKSGEIKCKNGIRTNLKSPEFMSELTQEHFKMADTREKEKASLFSFQRKGTGSRKGKVIRGSVSAVSAEDHSDVT